MLMLIIRSISRSKILILNALDLPRSKIFSKTLKIDSRALEKSEDRPESVKELAPILSIQGWFIKSK